MEAYAEPWDGSSLFWDNSGSAKEICRWDKKLPFEFSKWACY
jgi:hypothetical protein